MSSAKALFSASINSTEERATHNLKVNGSY
jgi:hypothetical protein